MQNEEFRESLKNQFRENFQKADEDEDGLLSLEEYRTFEELRDQKIRELGLYNDPRDHITEWKFYLTKKILLDGDKVSIEAIREFDKYCRTVFQEIRKEWHARED